MKRLEKLDIVEKVQGPTTWLNPVVAATKPNGNMRLCLDMRKANTAVKRERHVIPTIDDVLPDLHEATVFSKIDLREGYHQIVLHKDSRHITTFATHEGLFQYKRLIFGINSAFESFQKRIELVLHGCKGAKNVSDDILIWGKDDEDHRKNLNEVLTRLQAAGLKLNWDKCIFNQSEITFGGHRFTAKGLAPDTSKIDAILQIEPPTNATEVRSFLGLVNYCHRFIENYSTISAPLRRLTKKKVRFAWSETEQHAFETLKNALISQPVLKYYNPAAATAIITDASPTGLGAILVQEQPDGDYHPVAYGSRSLTDVVIG